MSVIKPLPSWFVAHPTSLYPSLVGSSSPVNEFNPVFINSSKATSIDVLVPSFPPFESRFIVYIIFSKCAFIVISEFTSNGKLNIASVSAFVYLTNLYPVFGVIVPGSCIVVAAQAL